MKKSAPKKIRSKREFSKKNRKCQSNGQSEKRRRSPLNRFTTSDFTMAHKDTAWGILNASVDSPPETGFRRVDEEVRRLNQVASMSYSQMTPVGQGIPAHIHPSLQVGLLKVPRTDHLERSCLSKISTFEAERLTLAKTPIIAFEARHALVWDYYLILNNALRISKWSSYILY